MQTKKLNIQDILSIGIKICIIILLGTAILNIFVFKDNANNFNNIKLILYMFIYGMFFVIYYLLNKTLKISLKEKTKKIIQAASWLIFFTVQVIYVAMIYRKIGFDCGLLIDASESLITKTFDKVDYFATYPNNIFLLLFFEVCFRIAKIFFMDKYFIVAILINIVAVDLAIWLIYKVSRKILGLKYGKLSLIFSIPLLGLNPYIAVPYSDTLSLPFTIGILYSYLKYKENKNLKLLICITILTLIGFLIKPTNLIITIAILLIEIVQLIVKLLKKQIQTNELKLKFKKVCAVGLTCIIIYVGYVGYKNIRLKNYISDSDYERYEFSITHHFMMGLKPVDKDGKYYGQYNQDDVDATQSYITKKEKQRFNITESIKRLKNMGIIGYANYLYDKYTWIVSDGTFFYGNEGHFFLYEPNMQNSVAKFVQNAIYPENENYNKYTMYFMQAMWCTILILIIAGVIISLKKQNITFNIIHLSIIGIILFILMFEARSRYLINYLPMFILGAEYGIFNLYKLKKEKI